jgi:ubiquinone/menaquinone biosynthesis C-methylase UbiE
MIRLFNLDFPAIKRTGKIFPEQADLSHVRSVLDVACGSGEWVIQTAHAYPQIQVMGIDSSAELIDSARAQAHSSQLHNASFKVLNPLQPFDFPAGSFDLINVRFLASLIPAETWPAFLKECFRITRQHGIIRLSETDMPISNSHAFEKMNGMISRALWLQKHTFSPTGRTLGITPMLSGLLQDAGYEDIQKTICVTNFSTGRDGHTDLAQEFARTYKLVQPLLIQAGMGDQQELDQVYQQMLAEMQSESFCALAYCLTVWGKKP